MSKVTGSVLISLHHNTQRSNYSFGFSLFGTGMSVVAGVELPYLVEKEMAGLNMLRDHGNSKNAKERGKVADAREYVSRVVEQSGLRFGGVRNVTDPLDSAQQRQILQVKQTGTLGRDETATVQSLIDGIAKLCYLDAQLGSIEKD